MARRLIPLAALVTLLAAAPALTAQSAAPAGPRLDESRAGVSLAPVAPQMVTPVTATVVAAVPAPATNLQPAAMRKRGVPQMIIGGAAIIGGALVGGDVGTIVSLGGLGYGIYGLYLYLN